MRPSRGLFPDQLQAPDKGRKAPDGKGKTRKSHAFSLLPPRPGHRAGDPSTAPLLEPAEHPTFSRLKVRGSRRRLSKWFTGAEQLPPQQKGTAAGMAYTASLVTRLVCLQHARLQLQGEVDLLERCSNQCPQHGLRQGSSTTPPASSTEPSAAPVQSQETSSAQPRTSSTYETCREEPKPGLSPPQSMRATILMLYGRRIFMTHFKSHHCHLDWDENNKKKW